MKGMLFGEDCERRIFYPNSQNAHLEGYLSRHRSSDPLASLGLMPSSPYKELKTTASVRTMIERDKSERSIHQRMRRTGVETPFERFPGTTSLSSGQFPSPTRHNSSKIQQLTGDLCSPVRLEDCGSRMPNVDALIRFNEKGQSMTTLHERMRGVKRAKIVEAIRLRHQADPNALIRRFLRRSGLPLDHVFATALRVYTRSRLRFGFSKWHAFTAAESRIHNHRIKAVITLQGIFRVYLACRTAAWYRRTRGPVARQSCHVIQRAFRARQLALTRITRMHRERNEQTERDLLERRKMEACTSIQAVWRGFYDREEAKARARQKLKSMLIELGGGPGRIHRTQDCRLVAGCLEHLLMAEACAVVLQTAPRCGGNIREGSRPGFHSTQKVLGLLLRCGDLLAYRRKRREKMRSAWARQAEAKAIARVERERARAAAIHYKRQDYVREQQLRQRERAEHNNIHEEQLKVLQNKKRLFSETADEERREQDEKYLMWREEVRENEIAREIEEWKQGREATEMVMMRREELLTKKAWALSDFVAQHESELRKDKDRIERLRRRPPVQALGEKRRDLSVFQLESKPAAVVVERFSCTMDGIDVRMTVVVRPSDECLSSFHQAAAVRATLREQDDARKQVVHWAGRSRMDTEHAARKRDEQFHLRCKTKRERQRKAEEVAEANSTAEESVTHLKAALKEARRATIARAVALADALGVKPPGTILSRPEKDEYIDRFSIKDAETIEGDARLPSPSAGNNARVETTAAADQGSYHVTTLESSGKVTPQHRNALRLRELMRERTESPVSTSAGLGWNREWSRTVDIWCREECDLFQERVAVEITKATHRLHWLGGQTNGKNQASMEKCHICRRRCDGKGCASLGDIADILELVRCTFDLVVLVEGISPPPDILASKASTYQQEMTPPTVEDRGCISRRPVTAGIGYAKRLLEPEPAPWFEGTPLGDARVGLRKERGGDYNAPWSSKCLPSIDEDSIVDTGSEGEGGAEGRGFETMPSRNLHEDPALERYDAKGYDAKDLPEEEGCPELERRFARLVLDPATIARTLGIKPLSAFALRAARQKASCSLPPRGPFNTATTDMATGILRRVTKQGATNEGQLIHGGDDVEARSFTPGTLELPTEQLFPHLPFSTRVFIEEELLSGREKHQIACAFESFLLPQLRISWYKSGYGDRILPHLSLELAEVGGKAAEASDDAEGQEVEASSPANPLALATGKESPRGEISSGTPLVDESG